MSKNSGASEPATLSQELIRQEQKVMSTGAQKVATLAGIVLDRAQGRHITDVDGRTYLDFMAGIGVCSLGYSHPRYVAALTDQLSRITVGSFTSPNRVKFLTRMAQVAPGELSLTQLYSG